MVLRSSPSEFVEDHDVTHNPKTQTSLYMQRLRLLFFATVTTALVEGCEENVQPDLPIAEITEQETEIQKIYPLFSEIPNDTPLINRMIRFPSEDGDISMGMFIRQDSLIFVMDSEQAETSTSTYVIQHINTDSKSLYMADSFFYRCGLKCLSLKKTEKGMKGNIIGKDTDLISEDTLDRFLSKISSEDYTKLQNGDLQIQIDVSQPQTTYTFVVTPQTTP